MFKISVKWVAYSFPHNLFVVALNSRSFPIFFLGYKEEI
jgi:hypothetical protein